MKDIIPSGMVTTQAQLREWSEQPMLAALLGGAVSRMNYAASTTFATLAAFVPEPPQRWIGMPIQRACAFGGRLASSRNAR